MAKSIESLKSILSAPKRIAIITHWSPDGDAIGSSLGLGNYLLKAGHSVSVIVPNDYPEFLWWMKGHDSVINAEKDLPRAKDAFTNAELIFCLDFNDLARINVVGQFLATLTIPKVMIDHHPQPSEFPEYALHKTEASSTCELIYEFIHTMNGLDLIDRDIANCLYAGIMTDTGSFRFPATTAQTHLVVADLIQRGAEHSSVYNRIYDDNTESRLRLLGYSLSEKLQVVPELNSAFFTLSNEEHDRFAYKKGDTEGLVNYALTIKGIVFAAFFAEREGKVKCSFRSKGSFDVNQFARTNFSGGGIGMQPVVFRNRNSMTLLKSSKACFLRIVNSLKTPDLRLYIMKQVTGVLFLFILVLASCKEDPKPKQELTTQQVTDLSVDMNSWDADRQKDEIEQYIQHHGWTMSQTKTGIYYMTMEEGKGDSAKVGQTAEVTYDIYLLDGKRCYTSGDTLKEIKIGEDYVESGLHEALLLMQAGDKMRIILPSHLANGLTGDQDKIGPRASVMYEIKLHSLH